MNYEDQVVDLLARADPAREETDYRAVGAAAYLSALQTSGTESVARETPRMNTPEPVGRGVRWLAAAMVIVVIATVGILLFTIADDPPVATTPNIEEPEPIPTTEPETTPSTDAESDPVGASGFPIFNGQTEQGDYEWNFPALNIVMTSDGTWRCVDGCSLEEELIQTNGGFIIRSSVPGGAAAFSGLDITAEEARDMFASEPAITVGALEPFYPTHPDAVWTGFRFLADIREDAPMSSGCQSSVDYGTYPCAVVWFGGWATGTNGIAVHGPVTIYILTDDNGQTIFGASFWFPWPLPPEGDHEALNEQLEKLIETLRFVP